MLVVIPRNVGKFSLHMDFPSIKSTQLTQGDNQFAESGSHIDLMVKEQLKVYYQQGSLRIV